MSSEKTHYFQCKKQKTKKEEDRNCLCLRQFEEEEVEEEDEPKYEKINGLKMKLEIC